MGLEGRWVCMPCHRPCTVCASPIVCGACEEDFELIDGRCMHVGKHYTAFLALFVLVPCVWYYCGGALLEKEKNEDKGRELEELGTLEKKTKEFSITEYFKKRVKYEI